MRRVLPLGLAVIALLAIAGIASHGRPLKGSRGSGPTATFFDYVATTLVIFAIIIVGVVAYAMFTQRTTGWSPRGGRWHLVTAMLGFAGSLLLVWALYRTGFVNRLHGLEAQLSHQKQQHPGGGAAAQPNASTRNARLRWDELGVFFALLAATAIVLYAGRRARRTPKPWRFGRREEVSHAIDESIDDLRSDPDLRRAIVAAYARMERALGRAGTPRDPAEAPFEYIERALVGLDTSRESARRLTALFEWAKFSQHEPEPQMRTDAIDALLDVRYELSQPSAEPAPV
jgi:hypothetical protein